MNGQHLDTFALLRVAVHTLLFLSIPSALTIALTAPLFYLLSRIKRRPWALALSSILGAASGIAFAQCFLGASGRGNQAEAMLSCAGVTVFAAGIGFEAMWRALWPKKPRENPR